MNCQVGFQVQGKPQLEAPISSEQPGAGARKKEGVERHHLETLRDRCLFWLMEDPGENRGKFTLEASSLDSIIASNS